MSTPQPIKLRITGMDCADCAKTVQSGVGGLPGVQQCTLNFGAALLHVEGDVAQDDVVARIRQLGYDVQEETAQTEANPTTNNAVVGFIRFLLQRRATTAALIGAMLILPGLLFNELLPMLNLSSPLLDATSLLALVVAGAPVAQSAWRTLRLSRQINMNLLMVIAAVGAVIIGAVTEAGLVMVLFAVGEALEGYTMERARHSIQALMEVAPAEATVLRPCMDCRAHVGQDGYTGGPCPFCGVEEVAVPVAQLQIGDTMLVKPGERIAMDGRVIKGASLVNQAPITGESTPVAKSKDAEIFAGSINGEGVLEIEVTRLAADNMISRIIALVEEAQARKAPVERFVDRFAQWYTPLVVAIAVLIAAVPPLLWHQPFWGDQGWLYRALTLLVVACPCALVISTPVTIISAISNAARNGVLIKGGAYLELLAKVRAIAFDKTGTLTEGRPSVVKVKAVDCQQIDLTQSFGDAACPGCAPCDDLLRAATMLERRSEHPLARAVVNAASQRGFAFDLAPAQNVVALVGQGVSGDVGGHHMVLGSHAYFDAKVPHAAPVCQEIGAMADRGCTSMLLSEDGRYRGYIAVADAIRQESQPVLAELHALGVETSVLLTGDNRAAATAIAQQAGIRDVRAELLPAQKVDAVKELLDQYDVTAMVGDGINDAPALAAASVGIAMGAGSAQALETADVALMGNELRKLPYALRLARAAMRTIRANIAFAIGIKLLFLGLVLFGLGNMWLAVLADVGASLLVTLNGTRLLRFDAQPQSNGSTPL